jgi:transposase
MLKRHAIQVLRKAGHVQRDVAGAAGVSIDTVRRVEREAAVTSVDDASARAARRIGRPSTAAPFRPFVEELLTKEPDLMSLEVLRRARLRGYGGGKSALYDLIASVRPRPVQPLVRFEGVPGEFSQHDFGQVDVRFLTGRVQRVHFFASRLKYSRWPEVTLVPNQQVETLARTLVRHFAAMGGVPLAAVFDRPTTIALAWNRHGEVLEWNPTFAQVMLELGVAVELCWPARGNQKGSVENLVGWVKGSFFKQRRFVDDDDLLQQLAEWHGEVQTRIPCRATGVIPAERMAEERRRLRPLKVTPETLALRIPIWVGPTGMVLHDTHLYSMPPAAIGIAGTLFLYRAQVRIIAGRFEATHRRLFEPGAKSTLPEHRAAMVAAVPGKRGQRYLKRQHLLDLGSGALAYLTEVIHRRPRHWLGEVDQLHALLQRVGADPLRAAFANAVAAGTFGVEYIEHHLRAAGAMNGAARTVREEHQRGRSPRARGSERAAACPEAAARGAAEARRP